MRAIVSLLKFFVGAAFLIYTIVLAFVLGGSLFGLTQGWWAILGVLGSYFAIVGFIMLVMFTGMIALLISAHDRLSQIAVLMAERNDVIRGDQYVRTDFGQ